MNTTTILLLGILLVSPAAADFCDGNFVVDAADWDDIKIHEGGTLRREHYNWNCHKSSRTNSHRIWNATRYGMPTDTPMHSGMTMRYTNSGARAPSSIKWLAVYDVQYTYTVVYNDIVYTNDTTAVSYRAMWLRTPYRCCHTSSCSEMNRHIDKMTAKLTAGGLTFYVTGHITKKGGDKLTTKGSKTIPLGVTPAREWEAPSTEIIASMSNVTRGFDLLEIETPANVLGYRIDAVSENHTAFYERNFGMMQRNTTESGKEFFDVVKVDSINATGMSAFGQSKYMLPAGDYNISMIVYTPFEKIPVNITRTTEEEEQPEVDQEGALRALISFITMIAGLYFLVRGL